MNPSIAIVDDHELFLLGLVALVEEILKIPIAGQFKNGKEVLEFLDEDHDIDLLILDLNMPVMSGTTLLSILEKSYPKVKKLVLSMHTDAMTISLCRNLGADGYISKDVVGTDLEEAIHEILSGGNYFITEDLINKSDPYSFQSEMIIAQYRLTKREMQILELIISEYLTTEIAEKLYASPLTIKTYRRNIYKKMGVRNLAGLITVLNESGYKKEM